MPLCENQLLSRIRISGFKSIQDCDISLEKRNVLIGSNGAGKSVLLYAFAFLQRVLAKDLQVETGRRGLNALLHHGRNETDQISFEVYFGDKSYGFALAPTEDRRLAFQKEFFGHAGTAVCESAGPSGHCESMWDAGGETGADDSVTELLRKQNWRVYHFCDTGTSARVKHEHNVSNNTALQSDAANLAAYLYRLRRHCGKSYQDIVQTVQLVAPSFSDFVLEPREANPEQIVLRWKQKGCGDILNASQLSDGTLRFACLATLLLQSHELQPPTILIDEPELGLHPHAISIFAELVHQLPEDRQIILATQSADLLNEFDAEDIIVADRDDSGSKFRRVDADQISLWLEEGYSLGELWKKNLLGGRLSR